MQIITVIIIIAIFQSMFLSTLLFLSKKNVVSSRILGITLILISYEVYEAYSFFVKDYTPQIIDLSNPLIFLYGPLIYSYTRSLLGKTIKLKAHIILTASLFIFGGILMYLNFNFIYNIAYIHILYYLIISLISVIKLKVGSKTRAKNALITMLILFIILSGTGIIYSLLEERGLSNHLYASSIIIVLYFTLVFCISLYTIKISEFMDLNTKRSKTNNKYDKYMLGDDADKRNLNTLLNFITNSKIYLEPEVSPKKIADELKFSTHYLAMLLNTRLKTNFYKFINSYRVEEFISLLDRKEDINILELSIEAGFNSKSTFNKAFKEKTGLTPSEYKKNRYQSMEKDDLNSI